jgi:hypothetical protein
MCSNPPLRRSIPLLRNHKWEERLFPFKEMSLPNKVLLNSTTSAPSTSIRYVPPPYTELADDKLDFLVNNAGFSSNWKVQTKMVSQLPQHVCCRSDDQDDVENLEEKLWSIDEYVNQPYKLMDSVDFANMTAIHVAGPYLVSLYSSPIDQTDQAVGGQMHSLIQEIERSLHCQYYLPWSILP